MVMLHLLLACGKPQDSRSEHNIGHSLPINP